MNCKHAIIMKDVYSKEIYYCLECEEEFVLD